jgi:transcriptional regulator GlxA family with amidase domain
MSRTVALYLYDDFQLLDACGPITSFEIAGRMAEGAYRLILISAQGGAIRSSSGVALDTVAADGVGMIDTLIVVGGTAAAMPCAFRPMPPICFRPQRWSGACAASALARSCWRGPGRWTGGA